MRTLFDACIRNAGGTKEECQMLSRWSKEYFRNKFVVLSREDNTFGGTLITILFQNRADKVFVAWVYPQGANKKMSLRQFDLGEFSDEDVRRSIFDTSNS